MPVLIVCGSGELGTGSGTWRVRPADDSRRRCVCAHFPSQPAEKTRGGGPGLDACWRVKVGAVISATLVSGQ